MVYDKERITKIIKDIEKFFNDLKEINITSVDDLSEKEKFYSTSMLLFSIINRVIDLGDEIVAAKDIGIPSKYKEIFELLSKHKIIPPDMAKKMSELVYYRNLLSHEYHDFTEKDVFEILGKIKIVESFIKKVKEVLK